MDHLPERQRPWVRAILQRAYQSDVPTARRLLHDLVRRLEDEYPSAFASVREGLDKTLTIQGLGLSERLQRSLVTTNAAESLISRTRHVKRNVKRWRGGKMMLRWLAAGVLEAVKGFRRLKGCREMPRLVAYLRSRDQQLGLAVRGIPLDDILGASAARCVVLDDYSRPENVGREREVLLRSERRRTRCRSAATCAG